jgi:hypothetical protein
MFGRSVAFLCLLFLIEGVHAAEVAKPPFLYTTLVRRAYDIDADLKNQGFEVSTCTASFNSFSVTYDNLGSCVYQGVVHRLKNSTQTSVESETRLELSIHRISGTNIPSIVQAASQALGIEPREGELKSNDFLITGAIQPLNGRSLSTQRYNFFPLTTAKWLRWIYDEYQNDRIELNFPENQFIKGLVLQFHAPDDQNKEIKSKWAVHIEEVVP